MAAWRRAGFVLRLLWALLGACPAAHAQPLPAAVIDDQLLIVAVQDRPEPRALPGATPRAGYRGGAAYSGSDRARTLAAELARTHALAEVSAWTITALDLRCMLYRVPAGSSRAAVLAQLQADPRVQLAQPLNSFETLAAPAFNDPYFSLQQGLAGIHGAQAQRWSRGERVRVAVIDTGVDAAHADLGGRVGAQRDFVGGAIDKFESHGTQVAGVIAAAANNGLGIVGVAPMAELLSYRACWAAAAPASGARCNSFTLAQALGAAVAAGADVINLSLGGPRDALLERLAQHAMARGAVVVGALPASGRREGFPAGLPGVLAVAAFEAPAADADLLRAPGQNILTLMPGGGYDFASGSSLAAAHVSGAVALLRALDGSLRSARLLPLLRPEKGGPIDLCQALRLLRQPGAEACVEP